MITRGVYFLENDFGKNGHQTTSSHPFCYCLVLSMGARGKEILIKYTPLMLTYVNLTCVMESSICGENKKSSSFIPPANDVLASYCLHYSVETSLGGVKVTRNLGGLHLL